MVERIRTLEEIEELAASMRVKDDPHYISDNDAGAECSCGRVFSVWKMAARPGWSDNERVLKLRNLAQANARRHACAANRRRERQ